MVFHSSAHRQHVTVERHGLRPAAGAVQVHVAGGQDQRLLRRPIGRRALVFERPRYPGIAPRRLWQRAPLAQYVTVEGLDEELVFVVAEQGQFAETGKKNERPLNNNRFVGPIQTTRHLRVI